MVDINKLKKELTDIPEDFIVLIETNAENAFNVAMNALKILSEKNDNAIIVSANRPYVNLKTNYQRNNIDINKMHILDLISKNQNADVPAENVMFMQNASSLTDISLSLNNYIKKLNGKKFIFIDSLNTMLIHNDPYVFARFMHSIMTRMRINSVGGILISLTDKTNKEIRAEIAQLCDKVIKIN